MHFMHNQRPYIQLTDQADRVRFLLPAPAVTMVTERATGTVLEYELPGRVPQTVTVVEGFNDVCERLRLAGAPVIDDREQERLEQRLNELRQGDPFGFDGVGGRQRRRPS